MQNQTEETNFESAGVASTGIAFSEDSGDFLPNAGAETTIHLIAMRVIQAEQHSNK